MLVRFRPRDAKHAVTRSTVRNLAGRLGVSDTEAVHYALAALRDRLLRAYAPDDGPLTHREIKALRKTVSQRGYTPTETIFPGF